MLNFNISTLMIIVRCFRLWHENVGIQIVTLASDAKEALGQIIKASVNLVISDFNMPDRDGLDLLQKIRSMPGGEKIAFILITGKTSPDIITRGKQLGMNNFVAKPFDVAQMRQAIEAVVGRI